MGTFLLCFTRFALTLQLISSYFNFMLDFSVIHSSRNSNDWLLVQPVGKHDVFYLEDEVKRIGELTNSGFTHVGVRIDQWQSQLSPWPAPAIWGDEPFGDGAEDTLRHILSKVVVSFPPKRICIGGYSLAGLFALWAATQTDIFEAVAAVSPSVWFPKWTDYSEQNPTKARRVYLSLGDKEARTRHPLMRTVADNIQRQYDMLQCDKKLEWNPGNHFMQPAERMAKGFAWVMNDMF